MTRHSLTLPNKVLIEKLFRSRSGMGLRYWLAIITAISFVLLVATAVTHDHASSATEEVCSLCQAVSHHSGNTPAVPVVAAVNMLVLFEVLVPAKFQLLPTLPFLLPLICGPPAYHISIC